MADILTKTGEDIDAVGVSPREEVGVFLMLVLRASDSLRKHLVHLGFRDFWAACSQSLDGRIMALWWVALLATGGGLPGDFIRLDRAGSG